MSADTPTSRDLTRRLIDREAAPDEASDATAVLRVCERVYHELSRWVGTAGSSALMARALAETRRSHPVLIGVRLDVQSPSGLAGVSESIDTHGTSATANSLEALLVLLIELLGRLIGHDLAATFIERSARNEGATVGPRSGS